MALHYGNLKTNKPMAQQTAVEWLINQISKIDTRNLGNVLQIHEQAKQMEKEQIKNAYIVGSVDELPYDEDAQQYYTKTYGNNQNK